MPESGDGMMRSGLLKTLHLSDDFLNQLGGNSLGTEAMRGEIAIA